MRSEIMLVRLKDFILSGLLAVLSVATIVAYGLYVQYAYDRGGTMNFRVPFLIAFGMCVATTGIGLAFGLRQLRRGATETERALGMLPLACHAMVLVVLVAVACGFDVVA